MYNNFDWKKVNILKICLYYCLCNTLDDEWVLCPRHERDGKAHHPSCKVYHNNDKDVLTCWGGCKNKNGKNACFDNISLVAELEGLDNQKDFKEILIKIQAIDKLYDKNIDYNIKNNNILKDNKIDKKEEKTNIDKFDLNYKLSRNIHALHDNNEHYLDDFFNSRAIIFKKCEDVLNRQYLEFRHQFKTIKNDNGEIKEIQNYIIFFDKVNKFAIKRRIDDICFNIVIDHKDRYRNIGNIKHTIIRGNKDNVIIFEGLYDLLSLYTHTKNPNNYTWISLNSISNDDKFISKSRKGLEQAKKIYIMTDNDEAGSKCCENFLNKFKQAKDIRYLFKDYNDVCDSIKNKHYIKLEEVE